MMCQRSLLRPYFDVSPAARAGSLVGDNEPHSMTDASDYTIPVRGEQRGLHHVAIEIRRTLSLTKRFSAGGSDSSRDCCRKHINESSPSLKPQTSFHPPQKKPCVPASRVEVFTRPRAAIVMRYAAVYKSDSEPLDQFIPSKGGINECAARFSGTRGEVGQRGLRDGWREDHEQLDGQIIRSRWGSPGLPMRRNFAPEKQGDQGPLRKKGFAFKRVTRRRPCHN
jgi:hypothetical protein